MEPYKIAKSLSFCAVDILKAQSELLCDNGDIFLVKTILRNLIEDIENIIEDVEEGEENESGLD